MSKRKRLSDAEIASKIRAMNDFIVTSENDRKRVLLISGVIGAHVVTRKQEDGSFRIFIPSEIEN